MVFHDKELIFIEGKINAELGKISQVEQTMQDTNANFGKLVGEVKAIGGEVVGLDKTVSNQERKLNSLHGSMGDATGQISAIGSKLDSTAD